VPNLFCRRAAHGEALQVLEDRPMAFIHVDDAAESLLAAASPCEVDWQVVNAATEVATIGEVARMVQHLGRDRGKQVHTLGEIATEATFRVRSRLALQPRHTLASGLGDVLDYFIHLAPR
jgi:nucleoside-diphosphate-sugar epimerase